MLEGIRSKVRKIIFDGNEDNIPNQPSYSVFNEFFKLSLDYFFRMNRLHPKILMPRCLLESRSFKL